MTTSLLRRLCGAIAVVVAGSVALTGCEAYDLPLPGSHVDKSHSFVVTAEFNDVLNLVPRSPVKVNDVTVGEVTAVKRIGWHAGVTMRIQDSVDLPENAQAEIRQTSLLGEKYVALEQPSGEQPAGKLGNGDDIPLSSTGQNPELEQVLGALAFLLNGGGVGQLKTITTELNKVFDGRQDKVRHVLGELKTLVAGLDAQKQDIISAMEAMNGLSSTLNQEKTTVTSALDSFGPAVKVLADQRDQLMTMLEALDKLGAVGTRVINASKDNLLSTLRHLQPVLHQIASVDKNLPTALSLMISFPFPIESNNIVHGDYANTSIVFEIDLDRLFNSASGGPSPTLPTLPTLPTITLPTLPTITLPTGLPTITLPTLPTLTLPTLLPSISGLPRGAEAAPAAAPPPPSPESAHAYDLLSLLWAGGS